jgi:hypothetical protein
MEISAIGDVLVIEDSWNMLGQSQLLKVKRRYKIVPSQ